MQELSLFILILRRGSRFTGQWADAIVKSIVDITTLPGSITGIIFLCVEIFLMVTSQRETENKSVEMENKSVEMGSLVI
jgi:hypothetical protein